jgi:hypothetical protein
MVAQPLFVFGHPTFGLRHVHVRPLAGVVEHQSHLDDEQDCVESNKPSERDEKFGHAQVTDGHGRWQHAVHRPGLTAVLSDESAELCSNPWCRIDRDSASQRPARILPAAK